MADRERVMKELSWLIYNFPQQKDPKDAADKMCNAINTYCSDALTLLKEQEPRVLTLEELQDIETPWDRNTPPYLWVEGRSARESRWMSWGFMHDLVRLPGTMGVQNYGSAWRVWTLQPSPEQAMNTPWEEVRRET